MGLSGIFRTVRLYVVGSRNSATTVLIWEGTGGPFTDKVQIDGGKSVESDMLPKACP